MGTKIPEILSASFWMGALLPCASATSRTIWASVVSCPTLVARMRNAPLRLMVAPNTSSPAVLVDGHALACEHRLVDAGAPRHDFAVDRHLLAGLHQQHIADLHVVDGDLLLAAVAHEMRGLGAEIDQLLDGRAGLAAASRLEVAPEQNERGDHRAGLEVEMLVPGKSAHRL